MLTNSDKDDIRDLIREELDRVENKIDKVLSLVTRTDQEHQLTQAKMNKLEKRTTKI